MTERSRSLFKKIPKPVRFAFYSGLTAISISSVACINLADRGGSSSDKDNSPTPEPVAERHDEELGKRFLDLPFSPDSKMHVQQGWSSDFDHKHDAIDYIRGEVDRSATWESFPVLAVADGEACANPNHRIGNAVWIEHIQNGEIYYTYYGHLDEISPKIEPCDTKNTPVTPVSRGEQIGIAGESGTNAGIHLHFQVNSAANVRIDPYDIRGTREQYPDPNFTNGKFCGEETLWRNCPTADNPGSIFVDMGDSESESKFNLQGWGDEEVPPMQPYTSPSGDRTKRFETVDGENKIDVKVDPGQAYMLVAEVEDGHCDDSFRILVNGKPLYEYNAQGDVFDVVRHEVDVLPVAQDMMEISFENTSSESCGKAAVFNVSLVPVGAH